MMLAMLRMLTMMMMVMTPAAEGAAHHGGGGTATTGAGAEAGPGGDYADAHDAPDKWDDNAGNAARGCVATNDHAAAASADGAWAAADDIEGESVAGVR